MRANYDCKPLRFARRGRGAVRSVLRAGSLFLRSRNFVTPLREKIREYPLSHIRRPSLALGELFDRGTVFLARKQAHEVFRCANHVRKLSASSSIKQVITQPFASIPFDE